MHPDRDAVVAFGNQLRRWRGRKPSSRDHNRTSPDTVAAESADDLPRTLTSSNSESSVADILVAGFPQNGHASDSVGSETNSSTTGRCE